jgi:hypothetical protein
MIIVRSFLGMLIHHSINNNLWDKSRQILNLSNEEAARHFTDVLLRGTLLHPGESAADGAQTMEAVEKRTKSHRQ